MKSGYNIFWTENAILELNEIINYLENNWTEKQIKVFIKKIDKYLLLISLNPFLFQSSESKINIRRIVIDKNNSLYYRIKSDFIEILSISSNRRNPSKRKI